MKQQMVVLGVLLLAHTSSNHHHPRGVLVDAAGAGTRTKTTSLRISDGLSYSVVTHAVEPLHGPDYQFHGFDNWASASFTKAGTNFFGGTFVQDDLWMVPNTATGPVMKVNKYTGLMTKYTVFPGGWTATNPAFLGGVFDGTDFWMIPGRSSQVVKIDPLTGTMTGYAISSGSGSKFWGGTYDHRGSVWMTPYGATHVTRVAIADGGFATYNNWPGGFGKGTGSLCGATFDGRYHWMFPESGTWVVGVDTENPGNQMTGFNSWPGVALGPGWNKFTGGVHAGGTDLYLIPELADSIVHLDTGTGVATGHKNWPPEFSPTPGTTYMFRCGMFDGLYIWMGLRASAWRFAQYNIGGCFSHLC